MTIKQKLSITAVILILLLGGVAVWAQTSANYDLSWHVVGSGGGVSSSASYSVNGTAGQSAASPRQAAGSNFVVNSGYWHGDTLIYLPFIKTN